MTFNLLTSTKKRRSHPWRLRKRNIAKIFENLRPDVVGTQEANFQQLRELAELLPDYDFLGEGNLGRDMAYTEANWYCATFYRRDRVRPVDGVLGDTLWLSPTPEVPASQFHLGTRPPAGDLEYLRGPGHGPVLRLRHDPPRGRQSVPSPAQRRALAQLRQREGRPARRRDPGLPDRRLQCGGLVSGDPVHGATAGRSGAHVRRLGRCGQ